VTLPRLPGLGVTPILHLGEFQGPLDLLLTLVERRRLPIAELSLVAVADQYLAQVRALPRLDPDALSEFLAIAARLLLLKSRSLLPSIEPPAPANPEEESDGAELVRRLEAYRTYKLLAHELGRLDAAGPLTFSGGARPADATPDEIVLQAIAPSLLAALYEAVERRRAPMPTQDGEPNSRISVAERLFLLRGLLASSRAVEWRAVCGDTVDEIVATLLAVLELVRRGEMVIVQAALFGPIRLEASQQAAVPLGEGAAVGEAEVTDQ
jgi:segregation and condensation protein A